MHSRLIMVNYVVSQEKSNGFMKASTEISQNIQFCETSDRKTGEQNTAI